MIGGAIYCHFGVAPVNFIDRETKWPKDLRVGYVDLASRVCLSSDIEISEMINF